jgi:hypothetical protein
MKARRSLPCPAFHYRALHSYSKERGNPCYLPRHSGIITPDKAKAKVWKTWTGITNWMERRGTAAGYELESFQVPREK